MKFEPRFEWFEVWKVWGLLFRSISKVWSLLCYFETHKLSSILLYYLLRYWNLNLDLKGLRFERFEVWNNENLLILLPCGRSHTGKITNRAPFALRSLVSEIGFYKISKKFGKPSPDWHARFWKLCPTVQWWISLLQWWLMIHYQGTIHGGVFYLLLPFLPTTIYRR